MKLSKKHLMADPPALQMGIRQLVTTVLSLLRPRDRLKVGLIIVLMFVNGTVVSAGAASLVPFLMVATNPDVVETNRYLAWAYERFGFSSAQSFLVALGVLVFALLVLGMAVQVVKSWIMTRFSSMHQYRLSRELMRHYLSRNYEFFLSRNSADLTKTILDESRHVVSGFLNPLIALLSHTVLMVMLVAVLVVANPMVALVLGGVVGGLYGVIFVVSKAWLSRIGRDRVAANKQRYLAAQEAFGAVKDIKLLGREDVYLGRYRDAAHRYAWHQANSSLLSNIPKTVIEAVLFGVLLLIALHLLTADGGGGFQEALPLIGLYLVAGRRLVPAFQGFFAKVTTIRFHAAALENFLADMPEGIAGSGGRIRSDREPLVPSQAIEMRGIVYRYPAGEEPALNGLDLSIRAGEVIGVAGASGAGKSTLVDILLGLLHPHEGGLFVDGERIDGSRLGRWQAALGYVPQHIYLADDTAAHNIALGESEQEIDRERLKRAAAMACIHDFILNDLPQGYDTPLGERGVRLSGGQRQRVGIARALYRDPPVLLLDEATSALDNQTERLVMEAIHRLHAQKTVVIVAHRLTTLEACDRIIVLEHGRVADEGNYQELMSRAGPFRALAQAGIGRRSREAGNFGASLPEVVGAAGAGA